MLILTIPLDLRRSLWSKVRGRSSQLFTEFPAPLNAHNPTAVVRQQLALGDE